MHRNKSVSTHQFAMVPRADIPRSSFRMQSAHKTTFDSGYLVPVFCEEVLPGDTFNLRMTAFCRMATPIYPVMDNLYLDTFFFFVPNRLVWENWQRFMGERDPDPDSSISYIVPVCGYDGGVNVNSLQDYFGLPTIGQVGGPGSGNWECNNLPMRGYNLIWNEWFRDQNLQDSARVDRDDGPDSEADYILRRRGKRHDYFTSALPFVQKGASVTLPLGSSAPVYTSSTVLVTGAQPGVTHTMTDGNAVPTSVTAGLVATTGGLVLSTPNGDMGNAVYPNNLFADLTQATAATINQLRQSFQIQKLLERDARGGTRYTEIIRAHFGVVSPDARLQRPEYLGGSSVPINISPIAQTSATGVSGGTAPLATLAAIGQTTSRSGFTQSFTEHGYVIGLANVRADLTYQQGLRRMWSRSTRYDFYFPAFAMLGEQPVYNREIYFQANSDDALVFGYQERWAEYRYHPSRVSGYFRSTETGTLDAWHFAQRFTALPTLNSTFIEDQPPMQRIMAVGEDALGKEFLFDSFFDVKAARPMPLYSVPGLVDHF